MHRIQTIVPKWVAVPKECYWLVAQQFTSTRTVDFCDVILPCFLTLHYICMPKRSWYVFDPEDHHFLKHFR